MDDLFDFLFTVFVAFFLLFFISVAWQGAAQASEQQSLEALSKFRQRDAAIDNLRVASAQGYNLERVDIEQKIAHSKVLGGRTITECGDYAAASDCQQDTVSLHATPNLRCVWSDETQQCLTRVRT